MDALQEFVANFTTQEIPHILRKTTYYVPGPEQLDFPLAYTTTKLGELRRTKFTPSFPLLDEIGKHTKKVCVVNDKTAWLFLCGNNVLREGIESCTVKGGPVIVTNTRGEVLGWGERTRVGVTNKRDRGDFLRRNP